MEKKNNEKKGLLSRGLVAKRHKDHPDTVKALDIIEDIVFKQLKEYGFKKHGRTLHRFVSEDISQVINFQYWDERFCVNIGIRVPECVERQFHPTEPAKKYYKEYECNIRTRLGKVIEGKDVWYKLKNPEKTGESISIQLKEKVLPVFDIMCDREAILKYRREYIAFDTVNPHLILLEEAMICGHLGDMAKAKELFRQYYDNCVEEYEQERKHGRQVWLFKGNRIDYKDHDGNIQNITASQNGYITIFDANHSHIDYLDEFGSRMGLL